MDSIWQEMNKHKNQARNRRKARIRQEFKNVRILPENTFLALLAKIWSTRFLSHSQDFLSCQESGKKEPRAKNHRYDLACS